MDGPMEALQRIEAYLTEFEESVEACRSASSKPVDWKAAYGALGRLRERYQHEAKNLTGEQRAALEKAFDDDPFIKGMMELRQVAEHVVRREPGPLIRTTQNAPVQLTVESSAMAVFAAPVVILRDTSNVAHTVDHLKMLEEARGRIRAALKRARKQS
jgi:hypothetical protein